MRKWTQNLNLLLIQSRGLKSTSGNESAMAMVMCERSLTTRQFMCCTGTGCPGPSLFNSFVTVPCLFKGHVFGMTNWGLVPSAQLSGVNVTGQLTHIGT